MSEKAKISREDLVFITNSMVHMQRALISLREELDAIIDWTKKRVKTLEREMEKES